MAQHDNHNRDDYRGERSRGSGQMGQYANNQSQHGGEHHPYRDEERGNAQNWGSRGGRNDGLEHADAVQTSYGRYGAPDIHGQPSGGYSRPVYEPARRASGQYERSADGPRGYGYQDDERSGNTGGYGQWNRHDQGAYAGRGNQGYQSARSSQSAYGYGDDDGRYEAAGGYQGGAGRFGSNDSRTHGSDASQGYGSGQRSGHRGSHHDPDYQQWREEQLRSLDRDYESWRGERYKKFSEDFDQWRKNRPAASSGSGQERSGQAQQGGNAGTSAGSTATGQGGASGSK